MKVVTRMDGRKELELNWNRKIRCQGDAIRIIKEAANKIGWDSEIVLGLVEENSIRPGMSSYNDNDMLFGFDITIWPDEIFVYIYTEYQE